MAGIYIHVPFCKSRCIYCDFYAVTSPRYIASYICALERELELKSGLLPNGDSPAETLYFGGGTPSCLTAKQLGGIIAKVRSLYTLKNGAEITLEANPDDITPQYAKAIAEAGINRVSLGVQSFHDADLQRLGRRHSGADVHSAIGYLRAAGLSNITIDLIYGLPEGSDLGRESNIEEAISLEIPHISAYALTYEVGTPLMHMRDKGKLCEVPDDAVADEYRKLIEKAAAAGYLHYEISNFAMPGCESRHNSAYWARTSYLGFGPAAHSYLRVEREFLLRDKVLVQDDEVRFANTSNISAYLKGINAGQLPIDFSEVLSKSDIYNERIMLGLRTSRGINVEEFEKAMGTQRLQSLLSGVKLYVESGTLRLERGNLAPSEAGMLIIDGVIASLFD